MRLLDKRAVNAEVATNKKQLIDTGIALSKKVDKVRETYQEEEQRLETFRRESIAAVQRQIDEKIRERDSILPEVLRQKEIAEEQQESNSLKLAEIVVREEAVEVQEAHVAELTSQAQSRLQEAEQHKSEARIELHRATGRKKQTEKAHEDAEDLRLEASSANDKAQKLLSDTQNLRDETERELEEREKDIKSQEKNISAREKILQKGEKELAEGWKVLKDRQDMFERNLKRYEK